MAITTVDLGNVKGPQGEAGPNQVTADTSTSLTGLFKGEGGQVAAAVPGTDYVAGNDYSHWAVGTAVYTGSGIYTLTVASFPTAYVTGMILLVNFEGELDHPDCYLNINGLGVKRVYQWNQTHRPASTVGLHMVLYDGTAWRMLDSLYAGGMIPGDLYTHSIYPEPDAGAFDLGTQTYKWNKVYAYDTDFLNLEVINQSKLYGDLSVSGTTTTRDIVPDTPNIRNLGKSDNRYATVYAANGNFGMGATVNGNTVWHNGGITSTTTKIQGGATGNSYTLQLYKIGRLVIVTCPDWMSFGVTTNNVQIGTIPQGYRPATNTYAAIMDPENFGTIRFYTDGSIRSNSPTNKVYCGFLCGTAWMTS